MEADEQNLEVVIKTFTTLPN